MPRAKNRDGGVDVSKPLFAVKRKKAKTHKEMWMTEALRDAKIRNYPGNLIVVLKNGFQRTDFSEMVADRYPEMKVELFYTTCWMFVTVPTTEENDYIRRLLREDCVFDVEQSVLV